MASMMSIALLSSLVSLRWMPSDGCLPHQFSPYVDEGSVLGLDGGEPSLKWGPSGASCFVRIPQ